MADPVAAMGKIVKTGLALKKAVDTVRHNEDECREIRETVLRFSDTLSQLQQTRMMNHSPWMRRALDDLEERLEHALELVTACQQRSTMRRFIKDGDLAKQLRAVNEVILRDVTTLNLAAEMGSYPNENLGGVEAKHPSERWRQVAGFVKNPKRLLRFVSNLDKRFRLMASLDKFTTLVADTCTGITVHFTPAIDQIEEQQKRCADYSLKALRFAITTFIAYKVSPSSSSTNTTFKIAMAAFFLAVASDLVSVARSPKWGSLLTYLSWFLLVLMPYLLLISFDKVYSYAIIPMLIPIVIVLHQLKLGHGAWQRINMGDQAVGAPFTDLEAGQEVNTDDGSVPAANTNEKRDKDLDGIFNLSAGVVNFGGLINLILGYYMSGTNKPIAVNAAAVFFFFFTIVLALYLMMATTVRTVALARHARYLSYLLMVLLLSTLIATMSHKLPGRDSHV